MKEFYDASMTLEQLEQDFWGEPTYSSHLVVTCHEIRRKPLEYFTNEDLRIMIGQNIGLIYLIPMANEVLRKNILAEGDMYEGDLLTSVLSVKKDYWQNNVHDWSATIEIFNHEKDKLRSFDTVESIKYNWFELFKLLLTYN